VNFINRLFKFYLNSSLHIAFSVLSLSFITAQSFAIKCDKNLFLFLFCSSVLAYNFIKYFGIFVLFGASFIGLCIAAYNFTRAFYE